MPPTLSWSDLQGRRVGLYGLGVEGRANLRKCRALGLDPIVVDDQLSPDRLEDDLVVWRADKGGLDELFQCDVVVKTPGISRYGSAVEQISRRGIPLVGGLGLWLPETDRQRVACITGTKGKSTTTAIAGHLLNGLGHRCRVGGNIGTLPYDPENADDETDYWVIEVSSYQATDLGCAPPVTAVTSLHPDHLPWHRDDVETYYRDKLSMCSQPGALVTIANGDSALLRDRAYLLAPQIEWISGNDDQHATWIDSLKLLGIHNRRNALIARAVLQRLLPGVADDEQQLAHAAQGFQQLDNRLRPVGEVDGVIFVDDSLATNVLPTLAAVDAFPDRRIALIVGGQSRGIDYGPLALGLKDRVLDVLVLTVPDNGPQIRQALEKTGAGPRVSMLDCSDLASAVTYGYEWARPGGVVLMSPAAPSFGQFKDYRDRGAAFVAAMQACRSARRSTARVRTD